MRTLGSPSGSTVARASAFGSFGSLLVASLSHSAKRLNGSELWVKSSVALVICLFRSSDGRHVRLFAVRNLVQFVSFVHARLLRQITQACFARGASFQTKSATLPSECQGDPCQNRGHLMRLREIPPLRLLAHKPAA